MIASQPMAPVLARLAAAAPVDIWAYLGATLPAGGVVSGLGVSVFVFAILRDKLLTSGQHLRRVADIVKAHEAEIANLKEAHAALITEKDAAYAEMKGNRDYYRQSRIEERDRADQATKALAEMVDVVKANNHVMTEFARVAGEVES